jgi:hypothetical protein
MVRENAHVPLTTISHLERDRSNTARVPGCLPGTLLKSLSRFQFQRISIVIDVVIIVVVILRLLFHNCSNTVELTDVILEVRTRTTNKHERWFYLQIGRQLVHQLRGELVGVYYQQIDLHLRVYVIQQLQVLL